MEQPRTINGLNIILSPLFTASLQKPEPESEKQSAVYWSMLQRGPVACVPAVFYEATFPLSHSNFIYVYGDCSQCCV